MDDAVGSHVSWCVSFCRCCVLNCRRNAPSSLFKSHVYHLILVLTILPIHNTHAGESSFQKGRTWLIFPDLKECELAKQEWLGQRYQEATFTTIEAVTNFVGQLGSSSSGANNNKNSNDGGREVVSYDAPWGSNLERTLQQSYG